MTFHLHTDIGHDPDDVIALCYLIEHGHLPTSISITPGHVEQVHIVHGLYADYQLRMPKLYVSKKDMGEKKYVYGPHKELTLCLTLMRIKTFPLEESYITCDQALVIGPAVNLGKRLETDIMFFQGGYSPNSINPLEKFLGRTNVMSYNPNGAKKDFELLRDSEFIKEKYYIGKNVCHGYLKKQLDWEPTPAVPKAFFRNLSGDKAMHDVLAAKCFIDKTKGIYERAEPYFDKGGMMTTRATDKGVWSLIGVKDD